MKKFTYWSSMIALLAVMGLATAAPVSAGEPSVAAQTDSDDSTLRRSGCRHPDRSKCRRPIYKQAREKQQPAEVRPKKTRRCLEGPQPHRTPRRC